MLIWILLGDEWHKGNRKYITILYHVHYTTEKRNVWGAPSLEMPAHMCTFTWFLCWYFSFVGAFFLKHFLWWHSNWNVHSSSKMTSLKVSYTSPPILLCLHREWLGNILLWYTSIQVCCTYPRDSSFSIENMVWSQFFVRMSLRSAAVSSSLPVIASSIHLMWSSGAFLWGPHRGLSAVLPFFCHLMMVLLIVWGWWLVPPEPASSPM